MCGEEEARLGADLYMECIILLNPYTGKMTWHFQPNSHDTDNREIHNQELALNTDA